MCGRWMGVSYAATSNTKVGTRAGILRTWIEDFMGDYTLFLLVAPIAVLIGYNVYAVRRHARRERELQSRKSGRETRRDAGLRR
jgi:hypothetical protein